MTSVRLTFAGSTTVQPLVEQLARRYRELAPAVQLDVAAGGSVVGIQAVHEGRVDIGMSSRPLSSAEREGITPVQIASDVLAIVVHAENPVEDLSVAQLRAIYEGKIVNWRELGGRDEPILPVIREVSSGTRGAFDDLVLDGTQPLEGADVQVTAGEVEARVASTPNAIGYVGFGNLKADVKLLRIAGVAPSAQHARDGSYPLVRPLLLLLGPLSQRESHQFVDFVLSPDGQRIVAESGWVPMRPPS